MYSKAQKRFCVHCGFRIYTFNYHVLNKNRTFVCCNNFNFNCPLYGFMIEDECMHTFPLERNGAKENYNYFNGEQLFPTDLTWNWWEYGKGYLY